MLGQRPPVNRMTHRCKNITFPQTSFAGGNYKGMLLPCQIRLKCIQNITIGKVTWSCACFLMVVIDHRHVHCSYHINSIFTLCRVCLSVSSQEVPCGYYPWCIEPHWQKSLWPRPRSRTWDLTVQWHLVARAWYLFTWGSFTSANNWWLLKHARLASRWYAYYWNTFFLPLLNC